MTTWTKETAITQLEKLINEFDSLLRERRFSENHTRWLMSTNSILEDVFGPQSQYYLTFRSLPWEKSGTLLMGGIADPYGRTVWESRENQHQEAYRQQLRSAKGLLGAALDELERIDEIESLFIQEDASHKSSLIIQLINITDHKLRKVIREVPSREMEVQEAFENLLIGSDIYYSREVEHIEYSSKSYIPDFVIAEIGLAIDTKLCSREGREKEIISEINDDILAYQTRYPNLMFIVYDLGFIRDIDRFIETFEKIENVMVRVVKH